VELEVSEAMKLYGIQDWDLTPKEQQFLVKSATHLIKEHGKHWIVKNQEGLQKELETAFSLL
jgi:hypothetical protein